MTNVSSLPATSRVEAAVANASARTGISFDFLLSQARVESGMNPNAKAQTSSATGLFQFTRSTWRQMLQQHGADHGYGWAATALNEGASSETLQAIDRLRFDPELSSLLAGEYAADNRGHLEGQLGRAVESVDLYLGHFLGPAGAERFLRAFDADPDQSAAALLPEAAGANRGIFYTGDGRSRSLAEVRDLFIRKLGSTSSGPPSGYVQQSLPMARPQPTAEAITRRPLELGSVEAMPGKLSLEFAAKAYQRMAGGRS